jgi:hypothetical protein
MPIRRDRPVGGGAASNQAEGVLLSIFSSHFMRTWRAMGITDNCIFELLGTTRSTLRKPHDLRDR